MADVAAIRSGWKPADIRAALVDAKERGRAPAHAVRALIALAEDVTGARYGHTVTPARLNAVDGPWWADTADRPKPSPRAVGPRCARHGMPKPCPPCAQEARDRLAKADPPLAADLARELARQNAAGASAAARTAKRRNSVPPAFVPEERPGLAALRQATEQLAQPVDEEATAPA